MFTLLNVRMLHTIPDARIMYQSANFNMLQDWDQNTPLNMDSNALRIMRNLIILRMLEREIQIKDWNQAKKRKLISGVWKKEW